MILDDMENKELSQKEEINMKNRTLPSSRTGRHPHFFDIKNHEKKEKK